MRSYIFAILPVFLTPFARAYVTHQTPIELKIEQEVRLPAKVILPLQYSSKEKWPVVVLLHGFTATGEGQDKYLTLRYRTSLRGFILVTPEGTKTPAGTKGRKGEDLGEKQFWNATDVCCDFGNTQVDDVQYIKTVLKTINENFKIDQERIYLIGHSNGGFMANRLGCEPDLNFAGIAVLAGGTFKNPQNCRNQSPTKYLHIHATDDETIAYAGTEEYAGATQALADWQVRNGCSPFPLESSPTDFDQRNFLLLNIGKDTNVFKSKNCQSGKATELWQIQPYKSKYHNPHAPLFNLGFTDAVLNFLFKP